MRFKGRKSKTLGAAEGLWVVAVKVLLIQRNEDYRTHRPNDKKQMLAF